MMSESEWGQVSAEEWNAAHPVGTAVEYLPWLGWFDVCESGTKTRTTSPAFDQMGLAMVHVAFRHEPVHVDYIEVLEEVER